MHAVALSLGLLFVSARFIACVLLLSSINLTDVYNVISAITAPDAGSGSGGAAAALPSPWKGVGTGMQ